MKKIVSFLMLFLSIGFFASAQDNTTINKEKMKRHRKVNRERVERKTPEQMAKLRTDRLDQTLKFTDKQRKEVYELNLAQANKHVDRMRLHKERKESMRQEMKAEHERFNNLLTPDQKKIWQEKIADQRNRKFEGREGRSKGKKHNDRMMHKRIENKVEEKEVNS